MSGPLATMLDQAPVLRLDGGLATELSQRGYDLRDPLWSAKILLEAPEAIAAVHRDYLQAGADIIVAASYQASAAGLRARGLSPAEADAALDLSVTLAVDARDQFVAAAPHRPRPLVAASIGPYGATLADGSEYTGAYAISDADLIAFHRPRLARLAQHADVLACETLPSAQEVRAVVAVLDEVLGTGADVDAWVSVSCKDDAHVCRGEPIEDALAAAVGCRSVSAVGVNCTAPAHIAALIGRLRPADRQAIVVYPNGGEAWDAEAHAWHGEGCSPAAFGRAAARWVRAGARIVGGCCRTGPEHIRALHEL
ncbi:MAG: homocysteine S-methyltransferase [Myxococcota bacterium]